MGVSGRGIRRGHSWLAGLTLVMTVALPGSAHASAGFTFVPDQAQPSLTPGSTVATVADLTGSGVPDLVLTDGANDRVGVMLGNGAGGFGAPTWYPVAGHPAFISVADFNNDGHPDLLVPVETAPPPTPLEGAIPNKVQILFGDGQGNLTVGRPSPCPKSGRSTSGTSRAQAGPRMSLSRRTAAGVGMTRTSTTCSSGTATETSRQARCIRLPESEVAAPSSAISPETGETTSSRSQ